MMHKIDQKRQASVLVVDDSIDSISLISEILKDSYHVNIATSGEKALKIIQEKKPDLILLDIVMDDMDGYEVCSILKADVATRDIPIIFLTGKTSIDDEQRGFDLGAVDYITKPASPPIVLSRVKTHLHLKEVADFLKDKNEYLERVVDERTKEAQMLQEVIVYALASLAETRDAETGKHIRRTQYYVKILAEEVRTLPRFKEFLTDANIYILFKTAPLHDIGKVGIPDGILLKPGKYEKAEFEVMKKHATIGKETIESAEKNLGLQSKFLNISKQIAYSHHEKWDGSGYPLGLVGEEIPIPGRLMAVADVYDAIVSRRIYKDPIPHEKAVSIIKNAKGTHFDPDLVDAFLRLEEEFKKIAEKFADDVFEMD